MEVSDDNLRTLGQYLQQTLSHDANVRRPGNFPGSFVFVFWRWDVVRFKHLKMGIIIAEKFLEGVEVNQNYPMLLLHLVHKKEVDMTIRIAGAIAFKNYIKRNWSVVSWHIGQSQCISWFGSLY